MLKRVSRIILLSIYFFALLADCYLLYNGKFEKRFLVRPLLMPCLMIYLSTRKSIKRKTNSVIRIEMILLWAALSLSWLSDIFATRSTFFSLITCVSLYLLIYPIYIFIFISLWKRVLTTEATIKINPLNGIIFLTTFFLESVYLKYFLHFGLKFSSVPFYFDAFLLSILLAVLSSLVTLPKLYPAIYQLFGAILLIILQNVVYAYSNFAETEINVRLYPIVALSYGLSQLLIVGGIITYFKTNQLEREKLFSKKNREYRKKRNLYYPNS